MSHLVSQLIDERDQLKEQNDFLTLANESLQETITGMSELINQLEDENELLNTQIEILLPGECVFFGTTLLGMGEIREIARKVADRVAEGQHV